MASAPAPSRSPARGAAAARAAADETRLEARRRSLLQPLRRLADDFRLRMRAGLRARGHRLEPAHSSVIVNLRTEGTRLTELASRAGMSKQAMGKLVDELEAIGYVERVPDTEDGRAKIVRFSKKGVTLLRDAGDAVDEIWAQYAGIVGERRLERLRADLLALLAGLDAERHGERRP